MIRVGFHCSCLGLSVRVQTIAKATLMYDCHKNVFCYLVCVACWNRCMNNCNHSFCWFHCSCFGLSGRVQTIVNTTVKYGFMINVSICVAILYVWLAEIVVKTTVNRLLDLIVHAPVYLDVSKPLYKNNGEVRLYDQCVSLSCMFDLLQLS